MNKFKKKGNDIEITDIESNELQAFFKFNIPLLIIFSKNGEIIDNIELKERLNHNNVNCVVIKILGKQTIISYGKLIEMIKEKIQLGVMSILIDKKTFQNKEPLILMAEKIKSEIVNSCIYIDYDLKHKYYSVISKSKNNLPNKLYFFEENNSILVFGEEGPILLFDKVQSIEDLICD
jgi:hypothetical protein